MILAVGDGIGVNVGCETVGNGDGTAVAVRTACAAWATLEDGAVGGGVTVWIAGRSENDLTEQLERVNSSAATIVAATNG